MVPFLKQYFKALATTAAMMVIYTVTLVPWIQPDAAEEYAIPHFAGISSSQRWWEPLFTAQDWEVGQPTVVHSSRGVLLAETWEQVDQKTWRLTPLTMVMTQRDTEELADDPEALSTDVWVIRAREGATIHFDQPLDLNSGAVPGIQRGRLEGGIEINKVSLGQPTEIKVQLLTRNLSIDRRRIWTEEDVSLQSRDLVVHGRVLKIGLSSDILSRQDPRDEDLGNSPNGPLEEIELLHLSKMEMRLQPGGLWAGINPALIQVDQPVNELSGLIRAQCGGRFTLNLRRQIATLNNGVRLWHTLGDLPSDEFHCHRVQIRFQSDSFDTGELLAGDSDSTSVPPAMANSNQRDPLVQFEIREIEAFGIDSLENLVGEMWVELKCPTIAASARAKRIRYDVARQRVELSGRLEHPKSTVSVAELNFQGYLLQAPMLEYQAAPKVQGGPPAHLGWMAAQGPGELSSPADSAVGEFQIRWQDHLHWAPSGIEGEQRMEVSGQTFVESKSLGFITAERLELWMSQPSLLGSQNPAASGGKRLQPRRLTASGSPRVQAGQARLSVESIDMRFSSPSNALPEPESDLTLLDASGNPMLSFLNQPSDASQPAAAAQSSAQLEFPAVEVSGVDLNAVVMSAEDKYWVDTLTLSGPLSIKALPSAREIIPEVVGSRMVMATSPQGELDLEVFGEPAMIVFADGSIQGPSVRFNQRENHLWIDHPGECVLPQTALAGLEQHSADASWELPLRCKWNGRMTFDGKTARCDGGVRISGAMKQSADIWLMEAFCQYLDLHLTAPIDFRQRERKPNGPSPELAVSALPIPLASGYDARKSPAEIAQISLEQQVDIRLAQRDSFGQRISLQRLQVPRATFFLPQQKIIADGPGHGISKFIAAKTNSNARTLAPSAGLQCAHLMYRDNLVVFLDRSEVVVEGNVRVLSSPIAGWDDNFDPLGLSGLSLDQMSLSCDQLKLVDTQSLSSTQSRVAAAESSAVGSAVWEMQATGNVVFEGNVESGQYAGNAYQVTYVQAKDLVLFRGDGRSKALLQRKPPPGVSSSYPTVIQVPMATLNLKTMGIDVPQGGLDVRVDFQEEMPAGGQRIPAGTAQPGTSGSPGATAPPAAPNPREGIKNFLRGY
jgi:hypothetical protein